MNEYIFMRPQKLCGRIVLWRCHHCHRRLSVDKMVSVR
jgi:predicted RNA-binding Zn-ribbon protein involved in translation (DUF1610 family)